MTNQEAIEWVNERMCFGRYTLTEHNPLVIDDCFKAGEMAIEALEQEPCEDAISRKEAMQCCRNEWEEEVEERLKALPPVMAGKGINVTTTEDAVSREAVLKHFKDNMYPIRYGKGNESYGLDYDDMEKALNELPSVQPQTVDWAAMWDELNDARYMDESHYHTTKYDSGIRKAIEIINKYRNGGQD